MHLMYRAAAAATLGLMTVALCGPAAADPQDPGRAPPSSLPVARAKNPTTLGAYNGQGGEFKSYNRTYQFVDWTAKNHHWPFQVRTTLPGATSIVWQFSTMPYTAHSNPLAPPGLIANGRQHLKDGHALFSVDYGRFLPGPSSKNAAAYRRHISTHVHAHVAAGKSAHPIHRADLTRFREEMAHAVKAHQAQRREHQETHHEIAILHTVARAPEQLDSLMLIPHQHRPGQSLHTAVRMLPLSTYRHLTIPLVANYYVRAVVLDSKGAVLGEPSNTVRIEYGDWNSSDAHAVAAAINQKITSAIAKYEAKVIEELKKKQEAEKNICHPVVRIVAYDRRHPGQGINPRHFIATADVTMNGHHYRKGTPIDLEEAAIDARTWYEKFGDTFSDAVQFFASIVDAISKEYEDLKEEVVNAASSMSGIPPEVLMFALNTGLMELGIPPSLPNFDQLLDKGASALTDQLTSQVGDVPGADLAVPFLVNQLKSGVKDIAHAPPAPGGLNMVPDPRYAYRPAKLTLEVTFPHNYQGTMHHTVHSAIFVSEAHHLFKPVLVPLPSVARGHTRKITFYLREDKDYFAKKAADDKGEGSTGVTYDYSRGDDLWYTAYFGDGKNPAKAKFQLSNHVALTIPADKSWQAK